jgi:hypothetical protein
MTDQDEWVPQLFSSLFESTSAPSSKTTKYRNKITYGLPLLARGLSPLAQDNINEVCLHASHWSNHLVNLKEVMAKCTRRGDILVRVTIQKKQHAAPAAGDNGKEDAWVAALVHYFTQEFPLVLTICYNIAYDKSRPTKEAPLVIIYGNGFVTETTVTGLEYQIGPDVFSEVNHEVEDLQYHQAVEWITTMHHQRPGILLVSGRDVSSFGLGFGSLKDEHGDLVFAEIIACQHCPLVHKDAVVNFAKHSHLRSTLLHLDKTEMVAGVQEALQAARNRHLCAPLIVVTTGGRKGLNPDYLKFLTTTAASIVYNSCSSKSLERDMKGFVTAGGGLAVDGFVPYHFFAGTKHTASLTLLNQQPKTLILVIGPAGVGKSTFSRALVKSSPKTVSCFERDAVFASLRCQGMGLMKAKQRTHEQLLTFVRADDSSCTVKIMDSTNGSQEARNVYIQEANPDLVLLVALESSINDEDKLVEFLLHRTQGRLGSANSSHPSFPATVEEQRAKHTNILKGIAYPSQEETYDARTFLFDCDPSNEAKLSNLPYDIFLQYSVTNLKLQHNLRHIGKQ